MASSRPWSFRLFRFRGVQVFVHFSWFFVAWYEISTRTRAYDSPLWNVAEYLGLFLIVLMHEFGHVLACRQTGGVANEILLWPLGGIAMGKPPPRAGAELWTIAAGPLVNVVLYPLLMGATWACAASGWSGHTPDLERLLFMLWLINKWLLIFNLLPVYPLDGGQILRSLLWFLVGRARSLLIATSLGFAGIALLAGYRLWRWPDDIIWTIVLTLFIGQQCLAGFRHARAMLALDRLPRHSGFSCPTCHQSPPSGAIWTCRACGQRFDAFLTRGVCPHCQAAVAAIPCVHCGAAHPVAQWEHVSSAPPGAGPIIDV